MTRDRTEAMSTPDKPSPADLPVEELTPEQAEAELERLASPCPEQVALGDRTRALLRRMGYA